MSLKVKLISLISMLMLIIGVLMVGVFAATQQTINLNGNVNFDVADKTLYVNDIRVQTDMFGEGTTIKNFIPGYINQEFNINLQSILSESGTVNIYFDVVNTSTTKYSATATGINDEIIVSASGIIEGDGISVSEVATYEGKSGTIILTIQKADGQSGVIDLSGITIMLKEAKIQVTAKSSAEGLGQTQGGGIVNIGEKITLTASFVENSVDSDFLGWRANSEDGELVTTLPEYTFTYQEDSPTTYYAIFETANTGIEYDTGLPITGEASIKNNGVSESALTDGYVQIPSMIMRSNANYRVTAISDASSSSNSTFYNVKSTLKDVTFPETLTMIGSYAFYFCSSLTSIEIPSSVTSIGFSAFDNCSSLTSIEIPSSVTSIGERAFNYCSSLTSIEIPSSVTSIGESVFESCSSLTSITIDENNPNYSSDSYGVLYNKNKTELIQYPIGNTRTTFTIPSSVKSIGYAAFYTCRILTKVTIPSSVTSIGDYAFCNCSGLKEELVIPSNVTSIGNSAFGNCSSLTSIEIPSSVTSIGLYAFNYCSSLTSIVVDGNNSNYSSDSYGVLYNKNKTRLIQYPVGNTRTTFTIPSSVTSIGLYAFYDCSKLTNVTFGTNSQLTNISGSSFNGCSSLTIIEIPTSVTSIGSSAFRYCSNLTSVTINATNPPTLGSSALSGCYKLTNIYVPAESVETYKSASGWSSYSSKISAIPTI